MNEEDDTFEHVDVNNVSNLNTELNSCITEKDVLDAVKCLKLIRRVAVI